MRRTMISGSICDCSMDIMEGHPAVSGIVGAGERGVKNQLPVVSWQLIAGEGVGGGALGGDGNSVAISDGASGDGGNAFAGNDDADQIERVGGGDGDGLAVRF